jgi:PAS domain S-box-containing protein
MLKYDSPEELMRLVNRSSIAESVYEEPAHRREVLARVLADDEWHVFEECLRCKDGSIITCNYHLRAVPGSGGCVEFDGFIEDITERKRAEEELERANDTLRAIIESAPTAIIGLDLDGNVRDVWNPAAERMLGWSAEEVMGQPLPSVPQENREEFKGFREWIRSGRTMDGVEVRRRRRDGTPIEYSIYASPLHDIAGTIVGNIAVLVDITERKKAEDALSASENRYRLIVETAEEGIWQVDREWKTTYVNRRMEEMLGCEPGSMMGLHICDFMDEEGRRIVAELMSRREKGVHDTHDFRFIRRDGSRLDALVSATPMLDELGTFIGSFAMVMDISYRKHMEYELRLNQFCLDKAALGIFRGGPDARIRFVNEYGAHMLGYSREELLSKTFFDIDPGITPEWWDKHRAELTASSVRKFETVHRRKDGTTFPVEVTVNYLKFDGYEFSCSFSQNIDERKRAEGALRFSERKYRDIVDHAPFGIIRSTRGGELISANPAMADILKYASPGELLQSVNRTSIQDALFVEPLLRESMVEEIFSTDAWHVFENRYRCKDGSVITCKVYSRRVLDEEGKDGEYESFLENITERLEAEKALRESEEKFRVLAETAPAAIVVYQGENIVYVNPAATRLFGYSEGELLGMHFWDWAPQESREIVRERGLARQRGEQVPSQYEHRFVNRRGEQGWAIISAGTIEYRGRTAGIATFIDISATKRVEEQLQNSLAEKEILLKEVHHRVKNNLQIISSLLDLQSDYIRDEQSLAFFRESRDRIKTMALVHERLYNSKDFTSVDFNEYVENLAAHLSLSYIEDSDRVTLKLAISDLSLGIEEAIPCGLIINELISNSLKHAFPGGRKGEITVACRLRDDGLITLEIRDNGVGLPAGVDFRNTETLGLQIVNLLVKQLRGTVELRTDDGASFTICFRRGPETRTC